MPHFRCTSCQRRVKSPVVIGAGDCPYCGGDVVFDLHGAHPPRRAQGEEGGRLRAILRRLFGR